MKEEKIKILEIDLGWSLCGVMAKVLDYCLQINEFELRLCYYVHFQTNTLWERYKHPYPNPRNNGLKKVSLLFFYKDGF